MSSKRDYNPRDRIHDASAIRGRSQLIGRLKYGLPSLALLTLLGLIGWPQVQKWCAPQMPTLAQTTPLPKTNNTAMRPEFKSTDHKNHPYTITADQGTELTAEIIDLVRPKLVMNLKSGDVVTLTSEKGELNKTTNMMHLIGQVTLTHSHGYCLETPQAWIDCNKGSAHSDSPVSGNGPLGNISAKGFRLADQGTKVSFVGGTQLILNGKREKQQ